MSIKRLSVLLVALVTSRVAFGAPPQIRATRPDATVTVGPDVAEGKTRVIVLDAKKDPVLGLTERDFTVEREGVAGRIVSVEPVDRSVDVPRHAVLVVDNSYSIEERGAINKLLAEVGAVVKTLRPIDDVQMVVLRDAQTVKMGGRTLHVEVFKSNNPSELQDFAAKASSKKAVTDNTFLYEEIFAGLELLRGMPADGPRYLWVFTDGEELNSAFKADVVSQAAKELQNLRVFAIDCMTGSKIDPFLATLASQNNGQVRKAGGGAELVALFQGAASKKDHSYVVSYDFPPPAPTDAPAAAATAPAPPPPAKTMVFEATVLFDFNKWNLKPAGREELHAYREKAGAELSAASRVIITGHTDSVGSNGYNMRLSLKRAEAVRDYLVSAGVDAKKIEVKGEGKTKPIADNGTREGRAKNRRVEIEMIGLGR